MESGKVICALFTGAVIGAAVGVLFAPEKGEDLRNKIADKKTDYLNSLKEKLSNITGKNTPESGISSDSV
ncbi:YtxH domain-containing protein [Flavobacterium sp. WC2509]|uniref:YtxH domain-containing protein n=1 Tax=Flavobacterium sp. WC2509 TaxID=3461406 RepID=UPI004044D6AA